MSTDTTDSSAPSTQRGSQAAPTRDILVIEDDPAVAEVLRLALQSEGYTVDLAADGYLTKPFDVADLVLRVGLWLRRVGPAAPLSPPGLRIHSLGRFYVEHGGHIRLSEGGRACKSAILFKYLLTHQERTIPTSEVLHLLWPDTPRELAATDLRSLLYQLRRMLGLGSPEPARL